MFFADGVLLIFAVGLWIYCLLDLVTTPPQDVRHLPKQLWLLLVIALPEVGSLIWLVAGRPVGRRLRPQPPGRPQRRAVRRRPQVAPDDDPEFLRGLSRGDDERGDGQTPA